MLDLHLDDHAWEIITNRNGTNLTVNCPFCNLVLTQQLFPASDTHNSEALVAGLLEKHLPQCSYQKNALDLVRAADQERYGYIVSYLMVAHDGRVWHYQDSDQDSDDNTTVAHCLRRIFADPASVKARLQELRTKQAIINREIYLLERAKALHIGSK